MLRERSGEELAEHLALVARWFYSKPRHGEICFAQEHPAPRNGAPAVARGDAQVSRQAADGAEAQQQLGFTFPAAARAGGRRDSRARESAARREWPYRRILRACARLLAPPQELKDNTQK